MWHCNSNSLQHYQMTLILITFDISLAYAMNLSIAGLFRVGWMMNDEWHYGTEQRCCQICGLTQNLPTAAEEHNGNRILPTFEQRMSRIQDKGTIARTNFCLFEVLSFRLTSPTRSDSHSNYQSYVVLNVLLINYKFHQWGLNSPLSRTTNLFSRLLTINIWPDSSIAGLQENSFFVESLPSSCLQQSRSEHVLGRCPRGILAGISALWTKVLFRFSSGSICRCWDSTSLD
jgi:hypothetical protein